MPLKNIQKKMPNKLSKNIDRKLIRLLANTGDMALKRRARRIIEELDPQDGDRILDVGCGDGFYLHLLAGLRLKLKLVGIDNNPNALESARRNLKQKTILLINTDLMKKIPFKSNSFNKVVISEVLEHLTDDIKGLKEVYRVLKPGGTLCLSVPNMNYPFLWDPINWILEYFFNTHIKSGFWAGFWCNHIRLYKLGDVRSVVENTRFKVDKLESLTWWCLPFNHYLINLVARLLWKSERPSRQSYHLNKYEAKVKKPLLIKIPFKIINIIDKLNDVFQPQNYGVGIFIKAIKI